MCRHSNSCGVFVDRWPLKPTLIASDLVRAVLALLLIVSTEVSLALVVASRLFLRSGTTA